MNAAELSQVVPGFDHPATDSQAVFRRVLDALSRPGRPVDVPAVGQVPHGGHAAAARTLLALLDSECTVWLSDSLRDGAARPWLTFHTGCRCVDDPAKARFLWLAQGDAWPALAALDAGDDAYPDQSATCVMEVTLRPSDTHRPTDGTQPLGWLRGPGVNGTLPLAVDGLPTDFAAQWRANRAAFPRGVDVLLATDGQLLGLPRSTRLLPHANPEEN